MDKVNFISFPIISTPSFDRRVTVNLSDVILSKVGNQFYVCCSKVVDDQSGWEITKGTYDELFQYIYEFNNLHVVGDLL